MYNIYYIYIYGFGQMSLGEKNMHQIGNVEFHLVKA